MLQEHGTKRQTKRCTVEEKDSISQTTASKSHEAEDESEKSGHREGVSHPQHYYHNVWNKRDAEHETTASYNRQEGTNRLIMMVKGTSNGFVKEQRRPPYSASRSLRPTCPSIDACTKNEEITEAVRIEQIRASKRLKKLANY